MSRFFLNLAIVGVIMVVMILARTGSASSTNTGRSGYPRSNRGFRNSQLSTARGFGKRDSGGLAGVGRSPNYDGFNPAVSDSSRTSIPIGVLLDELQNNPELARYIIERYLDENGDGEVSPRELSRTPSLFY